MVSLANVDHDQLKDYSMIELAILVLEKNKKAVNYRDLFDRVAELRNFSASQKEDYLAQFYTDINLDGRFLTLGGGEWGLKKWYSVEQIDEIIKTDITPTKRKKKKKKKKKVKEEVEPSIDDQDEDLTEIPLELVERAHLNKAEDEDDDTLKLSDDNIIDEEDLDDFDEDEEDDDLDEDELDEDELDEEEEDEDEK